MEIGRGCRAWSHYFCSTVPVFSLQACQGVQSRHTSERKPPSTWRVAADNANSIKGLRLKLWRESFSAPSIHTWGMPVTHLDHCELLGINFVSNYVFEKTLESLLDCKEIQPVHPKGDQSWIYIRRTNAEAECPILWPPDAKSQLIGKVLEGGKDRRQEERGWDGWMASLTRWTWVWVSSRRWWKTGKPGMLQSMGSQRVRHDWVAEWQQQQSPKFPSHNPFI